MSLNTFTLLKDATSAQTGGTTTNWASKTQNDSGTTVVCTDDTEALSRKSAKFTAKEGALPRATGQYATMDRKKATITIPYLAADGLIYPRRAIIEFVEHPQVPLADRRTLRKYAESVLIDTDMQNFLDYGLTT